MQDENTPIPAPDMEIFMQGIRALESAGLATQEGDTITLTDKGWDLAKLLEGFTEMPSRVLHDRQGARIAELEAMLKSTAQAAAEHLTTAIDRQQRITTLEAENQQLRDSVIAFAGPWAAQYARERGYRDRELHHTHYDILAKAGARMDGFTRRDPA